MKPAEEPYFNFEGGGNYGSVWIKIKKVYLGNSGMWAASLFVLLMML